MSSETPTPLSTTDAAKAKLKSWIPLVSMLFAILALRSSLVEPYVVPTGSMEPTLKTGDRLYALKCAYDLKIPFTNTTLFKVSDVKRGDVILFQAPHSPATTYVKRAVGLPGDKIEFNDGVLLVNGVAQPKEEYKDRSILYDIDRNYEKRLYVENLTGVPHFTILDSSADHSQSRYLEPVVVPEGHLFASGDNRDHSYDSRAWGFVPMENLKGKAMFIWFSGWDPLIRESMVTDRGLVGQLAFFVIDFFRFVYDWAKGEAWIRYEKIGTLIK